MKVLTESGLMGFARAIAENNHPTEQTVRDLFDYYSEQVYHEWTDRDIAEQAVKMVENLFPNHISDTPPDHLSDIATDITDYRDELIEFFMGSEDFNIEAVGDKFADAYGAKDVGVTWVTVEWAITEIHTNDDLIEIAQEAITEAKNNDSNPE